MSAQCLWEFSFGLLNEAILYFSTAILGTPAHQLCGACCRFAGHLTHRFCSHWNISTAIAWDESTWVPCIGPPKSQLLTSTLWPHSSIDPFGLFWLGLPGLIRWIWTWRKKLDCSFGFSTSSSVSRGHHVASAVMQTVLVCWCKERAKCKGKVVNLTIDLHAHPHPWSRAVGRDWKNLEEMSFLWMVCGLSLGERTRSS